MNNTIKAIFFAFIWVIAYQIIISPILLISSGFFPFLIWLIIVGLFLFLTYKISKKINRETRKVSWVFIVFSIIFLVVIFLFFAGMNAGVNF